MIQVAEQLDKPELSVCGRWLEVNLHAPHSILSWAVVGGGRTQAQTVFWRYVSGLDLPPNVDPKLFLEKQLERRNGGTQGVSFMTSAPLSCFVEERVELDGVWARCVATVGLGNSVRIGDFPAGSFSRYGTVNILVQTSVPLSELASIEAISLIAEARTLAVLEGNVLSTAGPAAATGTGTDCIAIASPVSVRPEDEDIELIYAGKHTAIGHLVGASVYQAVARGVRAWKQRRLEERSVYGEAYSLRATR